MLEENKETVQVARATSMEVAREIEDLPDEVMEFILSLLPPYKDLHDCMLVSKRWRRCVMNVAKTKLRNLHKAIMDIDLKWDTITPEDMAPTISKRYSHTAAIHENSMYVFGGCTCSMTTFNDLWRLDLSKRQWVRPLAMGNYPSPKACSSLVCYKDTLVLFGGWAYPPSYPLYQSWHLFNELHVYDITANRWTSMNTTNSPPPMAGHSVSVLGEWMIVFGGLQKPNTAVHCVKSNEVWKLNLETWTWYKQEVGGDIKPEKRIGQTQVVLNDENILIVGGSAGLSLSFHDVWVLNMKGDVWKWIPVETQQKVNMPSNIWTNPGCKIGDKLVVLNRVRTVENRQVVYYPKDSWETNRSNPDDDGKSGRIDLANRQQDIDENVNGRRGVLKNHKREAEDEPSSSNSTNQRPDLNAINNVPSPIYLAAFSTTNNPPVSTRSERMKELRLAHLSEVSDRLKKREEDKNKRRKEEKKSHYLGIYVLDLSAVLEPKPCVRWLPPKNIDNGPEETILYTLLEGKSEIIMFGGIRKDINLIGVSANISNQISNSLHFITAPRYVI